MISAYLKAHYQFELRDIPIPSIGEDDVLIKVKACAFCGHEKILADYAATDWVPFGHEISGIVEKVGRNVRNVGIGDQIVVETSTFNPLSGPSRDGRVDLDTDVLNYIVPRGEMGFAEYTAVPAALCVKYENMSFVEASMIEPLGVAMDLFKTADIRLNESILVLGLGPIGLMALQLAKAAGAKRIYAADLSNFKKRADIALQFGADEVIFTDQASLADYKFLDGGVDKVLLTAPPSLIEIATHTLRVGGILAFIGIAYGAGAMATFDSNLVHHKKIQIRASDAVPALYFPLCIDLVKSGKIDLKSLVSNVFPLEDTVEGLLNFLNHPETAVKAVMTEG
jgi:threonine dehydrogenase-like Zn-dependent dehydrogenase